MARILTSLLLLVTTACTSLPEPRLAEAPVEQSYTVAEIAPGRYHVMVRGATFAPRATLVTLLRDRAARLCGARRAVVHHMEVVDHPAMANGEVTCEAMASPAPATITPSTAAAMAAPAHHPERHPTTPRAMVASGPGLLPQPPAPGYIPPFARVGDGQAPATPKHLPADGWMPATGEPPVAAGETEVVEGELASPPFWPQVKETYRALYAGGEE